MPPAALISSTARIVPIRSEFSIMEVTPVSENNTPTLIGSLLAAFILVGWLSLSQCAYSGDNHRANLNQSTEGRVRVSHRASLRPERRESPPYRPKLMASAGLGTALAADPRMANGPFCRPLGVLSRC